MARGAIRKGLAQTIAALVAKSPWDLSAGISILKSLTGSGGTAPDATSLPMDPSRISRS